MEPNRVAHITGYFCNDLFGTTKYCSGEGIWPEHSSVNASAECLQRSPAVREKRRPGDCIHIYDVFLGNEFIIAIIGYHYKQVLQCMLKRNTVNILHSGAYEFPFIEQMKITIVLLL